MAVAAAGQVHRFPSESLDKSGDAFGPQRVSRRRCISISSLRIFWEISLIVLGEDQTADKGLKQNYVRRLRLDGRFSANTETAGLGAAGALAVWVVLVGGRALALCK